MPDPTEVRSMFARIAGTYDGLNKTLSMGIDHRWRKAVIARAGELKGKRVVDLCCGTGDLSLLFAQQGAQVIAADFTHEMVKLAPSKQEAMGPHMPVMFVQGDAQYLPLPDASMDVATVAFGIRNVESTERCLAEMLRVLRPGGKAMILEFPPPSRGPAGQAFRLYFNQILPRIGGLVSGDKEAYRYLPRSVLAWPKPHVFADKMRASGFGDVGFKSMTAGIACLHWGSKPQDS
ncbi:MAG: demethylmenaquinone methyltransferase/2-methoxy-6-polyprenyl-1,4-benzoquinol methylase [Glaciecola sp.]|jgi:demethylmenaquinone methyltransferase/2-methoxy-6-polyprenyl-1,4-benzoquinol methylase